MSPFRAGVEPQNDPEAQAADPARPRQQLPNQELPHELLQPEGVARTAPRAIQANAGDAPATATKDALEKFLDQLNDKEAGVRLDARRSMMRYRKADLPLIKDAVAAKAPLTPGQAQLLREAVTHIVLASLPYPATDRGFLGVTLQLPPGNDYATVSLYHGVRVEETSQPIIGMMVYDPIPGLSAYEFLEEWDVITRINDSMPLRSVSDFTQLIQGFSAGETVRMQVIRRGKVINQEVKLTPRPQSADQPGTSAEFRNARQQLADIYWRNEFADLVTRKGAAAK